MKKFGLIGFPLGHSFSKAFFEEKFLRENIADCTYSLYPITSAAKLNDLLAAEPELRGLNVTIPHKKSVIEFLTDLDKTAEAIGAVNCIKISGGELTGYNTDAPAFEQSLKSFLNNSPKQVFVLGTGGSAKAVQYVLQQIQFPYLLVSRQPGHDEITYGEVGQHMKDSNLFVNTTPLGMFPNIEACADIPYAKLTGNDYLFDLVYNPAETLFLKKGKAQGAQIKNGLEMLQLQAELSWQIWNE